MKRTLVLMVLVGAISLAVPFGAADSWAQAPGSGVASGSPTQEDLSKIPHVPLGKKLMKLSEASAEIHGIHGIPGTPAIGVCAINPWNGCNIPAKFCPAGATCSCFAFGAAYYGVCQ